MKKLARRMGSSIISLMLAFSLCTTVRAEINDEFIIDTSVIIDFIDYDMDKNEPYMTFILSEDESVETVNLPKTLQVKVEGREETETISVTWDNDGDMDNTENERYIFLPKWDETVYRLSSELQLAQLPYIEVKKENVGIDHEEFKETNTSETEKTIGTGGDYQSFFNLFNDMSVNGDVVVKLNDNITETITDSNLFIIPERFTSFTIESNNKGTKYTVSITGSDYDLSHDLFANGSKLVIGEDIIIDADAIYGGNFREEVNQSSDIEINGRCTGNVFGGGKQANVNGDTTIIINGYVSGNVVGGGNATPAAGYSGDIEANVTGLITIELNSGGYAEQINGGGYIDYSNSNGNADEVYTADVYGNVNLYIDGTVNIDSAMFSVFGGGIVKTSWVKNNVFNANVNGDVSILFGPDAKGKNDCIGVNGGGYASSGANGYNHKDFNIIMNAKVGGDVSITAIEDSNASIKQSDEQQFQTIYGGGFANGRGADVTVEGDVTITTARKTWDSLYGGGYAEYGGTADILGKTSITIQGISGQLEAYVNAKNIYGGGKVYGTYDDANDGMADVKISQANVGEVSISIESGAVVSGDIHGGGYVEGLADVKSINDRFDQCTGMAKIKGNIDINIADNIELGGNLYNGGYTYARGDSSVDGSIQLKVGDNFKISKSYYGAGYVSGQNSKIATNANSNVVGDVTVNIGKNFSAGNSYFGGGYTTINNKATDFNTIETANIEGKLKVVFEGNVTTGSYYVGAGYTNSSNSSVSIEKGINYLVKGDISSKYYYGGGFASKANSSANIGNENTKNEEVFRIMLQGNGNKVEATGWIYNGSNANTSAKANIYGDIFISYSGTTPKKTMVMSSSAGNADIFGSIHLHIQDVILNNTIYTGNYISSNSYGTIYGDIIAEFENAELNGFLYNGTNNSNGTGDIMGDTHLIFTDSTLNNVIYSGGYSRNSKASIKGTSIIELKGGNTINNEIKSGGRDLYDVNEVEYHITGIQNTPIHLSGNSEGTITNGTEVYVGNGSIETTLDCIKLTNILKLEIADKAILNHSVTKNKSESLFDSVQNLTINNGGTLKLMNTDSKLNETISGNFTGGGKIIIEAGKKLEIGGTASGTTAIEIIGNPSIGDEYISVAAGGDEQFNYQEAGLLLVNNIIGSQHHWILEAETVTPPNNELTGIINNAEYTVGELINFTAVGEGMDNLTPQNSDVRWVPINWLITEEVNFDSDAYTGLIDTTKLSVGSYSLTVKFKMQKYVNCSWTDTDHEDVKKVTFTIKAKSSSGGSYRPSGKTNGFVTEKNKTYYYDKGKPVESGFIFLDSNEKLLAAVPADQFSGNVHNAKAIYYVKKDKTIAINEWIILNEKGEFINTMPMDKFQNIYGEEYKIYATREDGRLVQSWLEVNGTWYYFKDDYTARYQYWQAHWNDWYLFENYTYVCNRWIPTSEGRWYYVDTEGKMVSNQWIDGYWINEEGIYWSSYYH